jgi:hypothetical protein
MKKIVLVLSCWLLMLTALVGCGGSGASSNGSTGDTSPAPPMINSVSPATLNANASGPVQIVIAGTGFLATSQVKVNGVSVATTFVSATSLEASIPAAQIVPGATLALTVVNGAVSSSPNGPATTLVVNNPAPAISALDPSSAMAGAGATNIAISGTGFLSTTTVTVNGAARSATYTSATELSLSLPATDLASAGTLQVVATNAAPGGGSSAAFAFAIGNPMPVVSAVAPSSVMEGAAAFTLDVKGSNFVAGSVVFWDTTPLATTLVSGNELNAAVPANLVAASSSVQVIVTTPAPGGGQSTAATFSILSPKPTLTSLSPASVPSGQAASVALLGSGFDVHSVVQWNGNAQPTTFVSSSQLTVNLAAALLTQSGSGQLTVINRAPGGGTSAGLALNVTGTPIPVISGVSFSVQGLTLACPQVTVHVTGSNFMSPQLSVNGQILQAFNGDYFSQTDTLALLPAGFTAPPGQFVITATNLPNAVSAPFSLPVSAPPVLAFCSLPAGANIYPGSSFALSFLATQVNTTGPATINSITFPAGITPVSALPFATGTAQTRFTLKAAPSLAVGTLTIPFSGSAGATSTTGTIGLTAVTGAAPSFFFTAPSETELGVAIGGSSSEVFSSGSNGGGNSSDYAVDLSISGLPSGTTASIAPSTIIPGDQFKVTVTAAGNAPESQNVPVTITGTPSSSASPASMKFTVDVTPKPGSLPGNRTDFVSTGGTPYGIVYDRGQDLIFVSNPNWNRIDVISNKTHLLERSISVRNPQAIDLSPDGSTLWIGTGTTQIYALNTTTFGLTRYTAPAISGSYKFVTWEANTLLALVDGTLLVNVSPTAGSGIYGNAIWNPATNQITSLSDTTHIFALRSGDGTKAYGSGSSTVVYSVATKTLSTLSGLQPALTAINADGSLLLGSDNNLYDGGGNLIGKLPAYLGNTYYTLAGSSVFAPDGHTLYQLGQGQYGSFIATIDVPSLSLTGIAPALATLPNGVSETPVNSTQLSVDNTGMLIGVQSYGVGFEDSTFFQNFGPNPQPESAPVAFTPNAGALGGGTASQPYGYFDLIPDVWYGPNRGAASLDTNTLTVVSPAGADDGPVNLKFIYPNGQQSFMAQAFSYSTYPQYAILSGSSPSGGVPGRISGYGMPANASGSTLTIGGNAATITTNVTQHSPYTGEPFPSTYLDFTIPAGNPGYADLAITTPIGSGTLPKAIFYAKSVTDYSTADSATDVLYDAARQQVYLSGTDHINVFSLASKQWLTPLKPAILGAQSQFRGMALTPDGTRLLAANILDNSVGVINPDMPAQTFAMAVPGAQSWGTCPIGPFGVAALAGNLALVTGGLPPGIGGCQLNQALYFANLASRTVTAVSPYTQLPSPYNCGSEAYSTEASADGTIAIVGGCLYSTVSSAFSNANSNALAYYGAAMAGDGNIAGISNGFSDPNGNALGSLTRPIVQFPEFPNTPYPLNNYPPSTLLHPRLNASGSLYYWAYPNWFEIFDVQKGTLQLRFSLNETIQNVETPIAIDPSGSLVFLITEAGLTVVDLGTAPLSIGYLSPGTGSAGTAIRVRGSGFEAGMTATVGSQASSVTFTDADTLTLTLPSLSSGPHDVTLIRPDGISYTLPGGIVTP